ncbi:lactate dehydrogenase [Clostridium sp. D2Q-11]|uniref:Lactate dehydrogenase n=1 Tax=Anaeromonas frigoriresistens TaxID=2683708 RepID=A0A942UZC5_9FIRM|nr:lactate dehydrogenase [Anaeromonas frigoriresistens]MBS4537242.1 lactate dehydrogenase [Anaeromonas frigoriresistens]
MYLYKIATDKYGFSHIKYDFDEANIDEIKSSNKVYFLFKMDPMKSRRSYLISSPSLLFLEDENINILNKKKTEFPVANWLKEKINDKKVIAVNTNYPSWKTVLNHTLPKKWRINLLALGDVGSTLLTGLKLLGNNIIFEIGIYDRTYEKAKRWEMEMNQVLKAFNYDSPKVKIIDRSDIFDCDMFVFCASKSVPKVGSEVKDVRMAQFESNSNIIKEYAIEARNIGFKGIFSVVSDPVDLLSKVVFLESNKNEKEEYDYNGLAPEQIRGYGLGVMNARAAYYANMSHDLNQFLSEGRAYGPHGDGLIIADSIKNYNDDLSKLLTDKAINANLEMRKLGYKPYIAPALSSGALSIIDTISGNWHYSATFIGGVFMGSKNRIVNNSIELESIDMDDTLFERIKKSYTDLGEII